MKLVSRTAVLVAILAGIAACGSNDPVTENAAGSDPLANAVINAPDEPMATAAPPAAPATATPAVKRAAPKPAPPASKPPPPPPKPEPAEPAPDPHAGHDMNNMN